MFNVRGNLLRRSISFSLIDVRRKSMAGIQCKYHNQHQQQQEEEKLLLLSSCDSSRSDEQTEMVKQKQMADCVFRDKVER